MDFLYTCLLVPLFESIGKEVIVLLVSSGGGGLTEDDLSVRTSLLYMGKHCCV